MKSKNIRVIFDTNVWISFLIGKRLSFLKNLVADKQIIIIVSKILLEELAEVTSRERIKKYFPKDKVDELFALLDIIAEKVQTYPTHFICSDPKDNFLLDLIDYSRADYLITGDKDLLVFNPFLNTEILKPADFEALFT